MATTHFSLSSREPVRLKPAPVPRTILFLQGPPSGFWVQLADAVEVRGGAVRKINLCLADRLFWRRRGADDYRGSLRGWRRWLADYVGREGVTDIVYYADRLPYHRIAAALARRHGIRAHAIEFGYLRPDWLTFEPGGNGAFSHLPLDPAAFSPELPSPDLTERYPHRFVQEATGEVAFNLMMTAGRPLYPRYVSDKAIHPVVDYLLWLAKLARGRSEGRRARAVQDRLLAGGERFWFVGLQLPTDYQLRHSAYYSDQRDFVRAVLRSFAAHAPRGDRVLFKMHPLDNGAIGWPRFVARTARGLGVGERVDCINGGELGPLLRAAKGIIVANSTLGLTALRMQRPVKTLGAAVYDIVGLTEQRPLDVFWTDPRPPHPELVRNFVAGLAAAVQVKGSIYHTDGRRLAVSAIGERLTAPASAPPIPLTKRPLRATALRRMRRALAEGRSSP